MLLFRQDFVSLKQLTRLVIDGCEVEDTLELGANLFIGNTDLKVRSSVSKFFYFKSVKRFWKSAALLFPSTLTSPSHHFQSWQSCPCMEVASHHFHCHFSTLLPIYPSWTSSTSATIILCATAIFSLLLTLWGTPRSWNLLAPVINPPTCMGSSWGDWAPGLGI